MVPLLLKSKDFNLPDNRVLAVKRLNCFQRRFLKDEHFYEMYKTFIADMVAKGYAKKTGNNGKSGKRWYIPHPTMGLHRMHPPPWQKKAEKNIFFGAKFEKLRVGGRTELSEGQRGAKLSEGGGRGARFLRDTMFFCKHVISVAILFNSYH